jgi:hypothetical protein
MTNSALDRQIKIALSDDQNAEKFAGHIADLAAQIVNATFKFSQEVRSAYESVPKRRLADKSFSKIDQAKLALGAFGFFMHALDRFFIPMDAQIVRDTVFDFIFGNVVQRVYAKSFAGQPEQTEKFVLDHIDRLTSQLAEAPNIFGEGPEDRNSAIWRAGRAFCQEDLGRDDRRLQAIVGTHLMQGLESLALPDQIAALAELLSLPSHLRKSA